MMNRSDDQYYEEWRSEVVKKYKNKCAICKRKKCKKHAHHLDGWNIAPEMRYEVSNGICLCSKCHNDFHNIYGRGNNTYYQFEEYLINYRNTTMLKIEKK